MRPVLVLPEDLVLHLEGHIALSGEPPLYLVSRPTLRAKLARRKARAVTGDPEDPTAYRRALGRGRGPLVVAAPAGRSARVASAVRAGLPDAAVLVVGDEHLHVPGAITVPLSAFGERVLQPELERAQERARVEKIRAHFEGAPRVLILMQDDPDPDAIASALALRTLLGRNRTGAPICSRNARMYSVGAR